MKIDTIAFSLICLSIIIHIYCLDNQASPAERRSTSISARPKAIIIGASSGIGAALADQLARRGYAVGITGRREHSLQEISSKHSKNNIPMVYKVMDVTHAEKAQEQLNAMIQEMGGLDLLIISAGTGTCDLAWEKQKETIQVNVVGFSAIASTAIDYFIKQGSGHLVGISSIAALRGSAGAPVYSASKAFVSNYLGGLRARFNRDNNNIIVTTIEPGFVDTAMGQSSDFWRSTPEEAATEIADAIHAQKEHAYITNKWRLIAWCFKLLPDFIFYRLF